MTTQSSHPRGQLRALRDDELADLEERFAECDADSDGRVDHTEFSRLLGNLGASAPPSSGRAQFDEIDADRDGAITMGEFVRWWRVR